MTAPTTLDPALEQYWTAVATGDEEAAWGVARDLLAERPLDEVLMRLVAGTQRRVGDLWASNRLTVAREHAATAVNEAVVRRLALEVPEPRSGPVLLVACVEREWHSLPVQVIAETLRSWGCRAHTLGPSASPDTLISHVVDHGPRAVLLSASLTSSFPRARRVIEAIRGTGTPVVLGGRAIDPAGTRARRLGATAHAADAASVVELLRTLPRHVSAAEPLRHPGALESRSIVVSGEQIAEDVVAAVAGARGVDPDEDRPLDHWWVVMRTFVPHVVDTLAGALLVEDPSLYAEVEDWLAGVLSSRDAPADLVADVRRALADRLVEYPAAATLLVAR